MKKITMFIAVLALVNLGSCQSNLVNTTTKETININSSKDTIRGIVQFPKIGFKLKSDLTTVAKDATVSILYLSDNTNANKIVATGLTDSQGVFTINTSSNFNPSVGDVFIMEAAKRIGGVGNNLMSVRTFIKWNGNNWDSITTPNIYINSYTTAVTIIQGYNNTTVNSSDTIGKININTATNAPNNGNVPLSIGTVTAQNIIDVATMVNSIITSNKDPFLLIKFSNGIYSIDAGTNNTPDPVGQLIISTSCNGCDLRTLNLNNVNLSNKDLTNANLSGVNLSNKDLSGTNLTNDNLSGCIMNNMDLSTTTLTGANLSDSYLVNSIIRGSLAGTNFNYSFLNNTDLSGSTISATTPITDFTNVDLSNAKWIDNTISVPHVCANNSYSQCN